MLAEAWDWVKGLWGRSNGRAGSTMELGRRGEQETALYLKRRGYKILERNFRVTRGEIDLVVFRNGVVAFVEVRTRKGAGPIDPLRTVTRRKQRRIVKAAHSYCALRDVHHEDVTLRFDVVRVLLDEEGALASIEHVENAFQATPKAFF